MIRIMGNFFSKSQGISWNGYGVCPAVKGLAVPVRVLPDLEKTTVRVTGEAIELHKLSRAAQELLTGLKGD